MPRVFRELDAVVLTREIDGWPAGSLGAIVVDHGDVGLVEMSTENPFVDGSNRLEDVVSVPYDALKLVQRAAPPSP